jgi:hypothetical protein
VLLSLKQTITVYFLAKQITEDLTAWISQFVLGTSRRFICLFSADLEIITLIFCRLLHCTSLVDIFISFCFILLSILVPDKRSRDLEVVVVRRIVNLDTGNLEWGGNGKGLRKGRSVYK